MAICFDMLKASLAGGYINFGVMQLYGDDALNDALGMFVKLVMSIPQQDLLVGSCCMTTFYHFVLGTIYIG